MKTKMKMKMKTKMKMKMKMKTKAFSTCCLSDSALAGLRYIVARCFASRLPRPMIVSTVGRQRASGNTLASHT